MLRRSIHERASDLERIPASEWSRPSLLDGATRCISSDLPVEFQYVTVPFQSGRPSIRFTDSVSLSGVTWSDRNSAPNFNVQVSGSRADIHIHQQLHDSSSDCNPFNAQVLAHDTEALCILTLDISPGDPDADEYVILTGFFTPVPSTFSTKVNATSNQKPTASEPSAGQSSTSPVTSRNSEPGLPAHPTSTASITVPETSKRGSDPSSGPTTATPPDLTQTTAKDSSHHVQPALAIGLSSGLVALVLLSAIALVAFMRHKGRRGTVMPFWERAPLNTDAKRELKVTPSAVEPGADAAPEELAALQAALSRAGLTVDELLERCARRRSQEFGGSNADGPGTSSLPPGYASRNGSG